MPNLALYRKYRPDKFSSVVGQDIITKILRNQIQTDRIGHAYLFSGIRGTGKTSMAKIFAKAVNCEHPIDGNPCGECESCKRLEASNDLNVVEIDAASNRGVDEVRDLKDKIKYPPSNGKYKVYIIDEAHMLTKEAFNALLKTLEEPPDHAILILATTEPQRLPSTILSRCQHYNVKPISQEVITNALKEITNKENINIEDSALSEIAKRGDHSMRDSLSLLDQCADLELPGELITLDSVQNFLGISPAEQLSTIAQYHAAGDGDGLIKYLNLLRQNGTNDQILLEDLSNFYQNLLYFKITGNKDNNFEQSYEDLKDSFTLDELYLTIDTLLKAHSRLKFNSLGEIVTNTALLSLCIQDYPQEVAVKRKSKPVIPAPVKTVEKVIKENVEPSPKVNENKSEPNVINEPTENINVEKIKSSEPVKIEEDKELPKVEQVVDKPKSETLNTNINLAALKDRLVSAADRQNLSLIQTLLEDSEIRFNKNGLFILLKKDHEWMFNTANFKNNLMSITYEALGKRVQVHPMIKEDFYAYLESTKKNDQKKQESNQDKLRRIVGDGIEITTVED